MSMPTRAAAIALAAALTLLAGSVPVALLAQEQAPVPVFVAVPATFPNVEARLILLREPGRDVVVLRPDDVSVESLSVGLHLLGRLDRPRPGPGRGQMIPVTGFVREGTMGSSEHAALGDALDRLRGSPVAQIGSLGEGRWVPLARR